VEPNPANRRLARSQGARRAILRHKAEAEEVASRLGLVTSWQAINILRPELKNPLSEINKLEKRYGLKPTALWNRWKLYRLRDVKAAIERRRKSSEVRRGIARARKAEVERYAAINGLVTTSQAAALLARNSSDPTAYVLELKKNGLKRADRYKGWDLYRMDDVKAHETSRSSGSRAAARHRRQLVDLIAAERGLITLNGIYQEFGFSSKRQAEAWARKQVKAGRLEVEIFKTYKMYSREGVEGLLGPNSS
jgi:hypothetical protein